MSTQKVWCLKAEVADWWMLAERLPYHQADWQQKSHRSAVCHPPTERFTGLPMERSGEGTKWKVLKHPEDPVFEPK